MDGTEFEIRQGRVEEATQLTEIAVESKAHWGYDRTFMARFADVIALDPSYVDRNDVWVLEYGGSVVGFYALLVHGDVAELDHLWLVPRHIGQGLGRRMFEHAVHRAAKLGARRLEWEAEPNAVGFYRRMGGAPIRVITSELGRTLEVYALEISQSAARASTKQGHAPPT